MLAKMVADEVDRVKRDTSIGVKMSKRSEEIINTSVCEKLLAIFYTLDADGNGILSPLDLEKSVSGNLSQVFKPFVKTVSSQQKPMDYQSFQSNFRSFLRVLLVLSRT